MTSGKSRPWLKLSSLTLLSVLGCASSKTHDIGDDVATLGLELSDYAAEWSGYAEAFTFIDSYGAQSTDAIELNIDGNGQGYLRVGSAPPFPPVTDPNTFPQGDYSEEGDLDGNIDTSVVVSGRDYPVYDATVETHRLKLWVAPADFYADWCALQTPFATGDPSMPFNCVPPAVVAYTENEDGTCSADDSETSFSCGALVGCRSYHLCECSETVCGARHRPKVQLDAALDDDGNTLEGTLLFDNGERIVVRMTK